MKPPIADTLYVLTPQAGDEVPTQERVPGQFGIHRAAGARARPPGAIECRHALLDELICLRHAVLRPQTSLEEAVLPGDHDEQTRHYGAFNDHGRAVACVSLMASDWEAQPAWQLRAMAVAEPLRGTGVGSALLGYALRDLALQHRASPIWCNARVSAQRFYERHGWAAMSAPFDNGAAGPSVRMLRPATQTSGRVIKAAGPVNSEAPWH